MNRLLILFVFVWTVTCSSIWAQTDPDLETLPNQIEVIDSSGYQITIAQTAHTKPFRCQIFPVHVESNLQVILPLQENFTLRLVDEEGNILFSHYQIFGENQVNLSHLKAAKYFVEITSSKGTVIEQIIKT